MQRLRIAILLLFSFVLHVQCHAILVLVPQKGDTGQFAASHAVGESINVGVRLDVTPARDAYWIGVDCQQITPIIQSQLNIEHGLAVLEVADPSPAWRAGVKQYDILVQFEAKPLLNCEQFANLIDHFGEQDIYISLLRHGKLHKLKIRPERRPLCKVASIIVVAQPDGSFDLERAKAEIAEATKSKPCPDSLQKFELIFVQNPRLLTTFNTAVDERTQFTAAATKSSPYTKAALLACVGDCKNTEWYRVYDEVQNQILTLSEIERACGNEWRRFEEYFSQLEAQHRAAKRMLHWQLNQLTTSTDPKMLDEIWQQRCEVEDALLKWEQVSKKLRCYGDAIRANGDRRNRQTSVNDSPYRMPAKADVPHANR
ncbi:MAG TPA: S1C family serine protease [Pirellulaceae bacterium]|nr:S1C family serine protease [Pirellulaceae bacterium]HMO91190.1 S1C family serine protease [Pirellulaceae bacterium]HMP69040.1 S1C family serine protease [Pirellulaceae bacterium]